MQHMQNHIGRDLDLDALASAANLSKFHFIRRFKARTGQTPIQHFIHIKMQHACQLLDRLRRSVVFFALIQARDWRVAAALSGTPHDISHTT